VRAAAVQLNSNEDADRNRTDAAELVRAAAGAGATLVVLPEKWNRIGRPEVVAAAAEPLDGPSTTWARELARELSIDLVAGSIVEQAPEGRFNTSVHVGPDGGLRAVYRKLHLFDVEVAGRVYRESDHESPGEQIVTTTLVDGTLLGLSVCYDLRFPELFRALALRGARAVSLPSAFTRPTTLDHWEVLIRARAIEEQVFMIAANQVGGHPGGFESGGDSLIVDPWGDVLARAPADQPGYVAAELDAASQDGMRARLPLFAHRRPEVYGR